MLGRVRVIINYLLWRAGRRDVLPGYYIARIPIEECGEELVQLLPSSALALDTRRTSTHLARRSVAVALAKASAMLPNGLSLLIVEAYRSHATQAERWHVKRQEIAGANPHLEGLELDRLTSMAVANPTSGHVGGHQSGGAVDLTLVDSHGNELWMGTSVQKFSDAAPTNVATDPDVIQRRALLVEVMTGAGFVNYPAEWWHFSLGDQLWAAYGRKRCARFGPVLAIPETE